MTLKLIATDDTFVGAAVWIRFSSCSFGAFLELVFFVFRLGSVRKVEHSNTTGRLIQLRRSCVSLVANGDLMRLFESESLKSLIAPIRKNASPGWLFRRKKVSRGANFLFCGGELQRGRCNSNSLYLSSSYRSQLVQEQPCSGVT